MVPFRANPCFSVVCTQYLLDTCVKLAAVPEPVMALRLLLAGAHSASEEAGLEMLAYEFFEQVDLGLFVVQAHGPEYETCFVEDGPGDAGV